MVTNSKSNKTASSSSSSSSKNATSASASTSTEQQPPAKEVSSAETHIEILTEHFGFSPKLILEKLAYLSNEHLYRIGDTFESFALQNLLEKINQSEQQSKSKFVNPKSKTKSKQNLQQVADANLEAESGVHGILTLFENALDHTLDTFELCLYRSVCGVTQTQADNMILSHHEGLDLRNKEEKERALRKWKREKERGEKERKKAGGKQEEPIKVEGNGIGIDGEEEVDVESFAYSLNEKERLLRRKINAGKACRSSLQSAQSVSQKRLSRHNHLNRNFSLLLGDPLSSEILSEQAPATQDRPDTAGTDPAFTNSVPLSAKKLRADTISLLAALTELRSQDPLGQSLSLPLGASASDPQKADGVKVEDSATTPWSNREDYIKWNANKATANIVSQEDQGGDRRGKGKSRSVDDLESDDLPSSSGSGSGKRKSNAGMKRLRNEDARDDESKKRYLKIGEMEDVEMLSKGLANQN